MSEIWNLSTLCRCCHADGYFKALNVPYCYMEELEVYADMLRDTFGLLLNSPLIEASYSICDDCISQLREATKFKKKATMCEEKFENYCKNELLQQLQMKSEKFNNGTFSNNNCEYENVFDTKFDSRMSKTESSEEINGEIENTLQSSALNPVINETENKLLKARKKKVQTCKKYICKYCKKIFKNKHNWGSHEHGHEDLSKTCNVCGKILKTQTQLINHINTHTKQTVFSSKLICDICNKLLLNKQSLRIHISRHYGTNKRFMCDICGNSFNDITNLKKHILAVHEKLRSFHCTMCPKTFKAKKDLKVHFRRHTGERPYKCDTCGQGFICNYYLTRHNNKHRKINFDAKYLCKVCDEQFSYRGDYSKHLRSHSSRHKCLICSRGFTCQFALTRHMDSHSGVKRFQCDTCNTKFLSKAQLERHFDNHHNPNKVVKKKLKCDQCNLAVTDMKKHLNVHRNRAFKCEQCSKAYSEANALNRHIREIHLGIKVICSICSKTYVKRATLWNHMLKKHKIDMRKRDKENEETDVLKG